jgi:hypothetical protein
MFVSAAAASIKRSSKCVVRVIQVNADGRIGNCVLLAVITSHNTAVVFFAFCADVMT